MGYAEDRGDYWRGRYKLPNGRYGTVKDAAGVTRRGSIPRLVETSTVWLNFVLPNVLSCRTASASGIGSTGAFSRKAR